MGDLTWEGMHFVHTQDIPLMAASLAHVVTYDFILHVH